MPTIIAIEGCDAAGKRTQAGLLQKALLDSRPNLRVQLRAFPRYDTPVGQTLLQLLKGDLLLAGDVTSMDLPRVEQGLFFMDKCSAAAAWQMQTLDFVICDRWIGTAFAYGMADGLDRAWLAAIHGLLPQATVNVFLDVPPEEALKRRPEARDRYERDREKQAIVYKNYHDLAQDTRHWATVDGEGTPQEVHARVMAAIRRVGGVYL